MVAPENLLRADESLSQLLGAPLRRVGAGESGAAIYEGIAAVESVYPYPEQGDGYAEYITPDAIRATVDGLLGQPVFLGERVSGRYIHPAKNGRLVEATPDSWRTHTIGTVLDTALVDLDGAAACWVRISILDAAAQDLIDSGVASALSPLYRVTVLDPNGGEWGGTPYSAAQRGRALNNLCLVTAGRGGENCILRADEAPGETMTPEQIQALIDAVVAGVTAAMKPAEKPEVEVEMSPDACGTATRAKMDAMQAKIDAFEAEKTNAAMKADAETRAAALTNLGIKVDGFDPAAPTAEMIQRADAAILAHAAKRTARAADPFGNGAQVDPPRADAQPTPSTHYAI